MPETLIDPTGTRDLDTNTTLTPRPGTVSGRTIGLLDNTKPNAAVLLQELGDVLTRQYGARGVLLYTKPYFGTPVEQVQVGEIAEQVDLAITGVGD